MNKVLPDSVLTQAWEVITYKNKYSQIFFPFVESCDKSYMQHNQEKGNSLDLAKR